jgi:hypothetical protein
MDVVSDSAYTLVSASLLRGLWRHPQKYYVAFGECDAGNGDFAIGRTDAEPVPSGH